MHAKNYSTDVSESSFRSNDLLVHLRSEINKVFEKNAGLQTGTSPGSPLPIDKGQSLHLNVTETDGAITIEAELSGFRPSEVDVSILNQSVIIETCRSDVQSKSYYLGEYSQPSSRWLIPLECELKKDSIKTQFTKETLIISVLKKVGVNDFAAFEPA